MYIAIEYEIHFTIIQSFFALYFLFVCLVVFPLAAAEIFGFVTKVRTFEDLGVDGTIILTWNGLIWMRMWTEQ